MVCMHARDASRADGAGRLSEIYEAALPEVYRYLRARCGSTDLAEELTSATFVQAAMLSTRGDAPPIAIGWLMTVARNKLIDHWRREAVAARSVTVLEGGRVDRVDPWDAVLDQERANVVLHALPAHYRSVLTLRYLDDLGVNECAELLDRSVHSTESLLARARAAFRLNYEETRGRDE